MLVRIPLLRYKMRALIEYFAKNAKDRKANLKRLGLSCLGQFKSPGQSPRGQQFGRQPFRGQQGYPYQPGAYAGAPGMERRVSSAGSEGDSFLQGGEESYDYQQLASDNSQDTQQSAGGDVGHSQAGFHGAFGNGSGQIGLDSEQDQQRGIDSGQGADPGGGAGSGPPQSPPDIKYEVTPMPFMKANDFELIEIDPDDEDDI